MEKPVDQGEASHMRREQVPQGEIIVVFSIKYLHGFIEKVRKLRRIICMNFGGCFIMRH